MVLYFSVTRETDEAVKLQTLVITKKISRLVPGFIGIALCAMTGNALAAETAAEKATAADEKPTAAGEEVYHTPLAGEELHVTFNGQSIHIPARNRDDTLALTLGGVSFSPQLGGQAAVPFAALYWRHRWEKYRARAIVAVFENEADVARSFGEFELLGHLENDTVPLSRAEIVNGSEFKESSIIWGSFSGWLGAGWRHPVAPFQADNDLRLQLFYHAGYLYSGRTADTGLGVRLPPDTLVHGVRFRARYDGLSRNLLELPHEGWAGGGDIELTRRNGWSDANYGGSEYSGNSTRDYVKLSGYLMGAVGVPGLSERNRILVSVYGGFAPGRNLDRFSAFRLGGGPFPNETDDLYRLAYPGAMFNQFPVTDYVIGTTEYRRELLFCLYLHLRGTFAWANRDILTASNFKFSDDHGEAFSAGLTTGFFWESQLYLEYAHDTGLLRNGRSGESALVLWSKSF